MKRSGRKTDRVFNFHAKPWALLCLVILVSSCSRQAVYKQHPGQLTVQQAPYSPYGTDTAVNAVQPDPKTESAFTQPLPKIESPAVKKDADTRENQLSLRKNHLPVKPHLPKAPIQDPENEPPPPRMSTTDVIAFLSLAAATGLTLMLVLVAFADLAPLFIVLTVFLFFFGLSFVAIDKRGRVERRMAIIAALLAGLVGTLLLPEAGIIIMGMALVLLLAELAATADLPVIVKPPSVRRMPDQDDNRQPGRKASKQMLKAAKYLGILFVLGIILIIIGSLAWSFGVIIIGSVFSAIGFYGGIIMLILAGAFALAGH